MECLKRNNIVILEKKGFWTFIVDARTKCGNRARGDRCTDFFTRDINFNNIENKNII